MNSGHDEMEKIEIRLLHDVDREAMIALYREAGWWEEGDKDTPETVSAIVRGSFYFAGAFSRERLVGMARAISDGVSDAYIQDVVVLASYRGQGIGQKLVQTVAGFLRSRGIGWIGLIAEPGTQAFYEGIGFSLLDGYVPMRLKDR